MKTVRRILRRRRPVPQSQRRRSEKIQEDDQSQNALLARALLLIVPHVQGLRVQCEAKLFRNGKKLLSVPVVHQPVTVLPADSLLCKATIP